MPDTQVLQVILGAFKNFSQGTSLLVMLEDIWTSALNPSSKLHPWQSNERQSLDLASILIWCCSCAQLLFLQCLRLGQTFSARSHKPVQPFHPSCLHSQHYPGGSASGRDLGQICLNASGNLGPPCQCKPVQTANQLFR